MFYTTPPPIHNQSNNNRVLVFTLVPYKCQFFKIEFEFIPIIVMRPRVVYCRVSRHPPLEPYLWKLHFFFFLYKNIFKNNHASALSTQIDTIMRFPTKRYAFFSLSNLGTVRKPVTHSRASNREATRVSRLW